MRQLSHLERAIEYIEAHLNENIGLSDVSKEVGYSYYHMSRLFSYALGESVGRYINRRRLFNASQMLIHSNLRVIDIAFECGFESSEAFSRAFKAAFGSSPASYRKAGLNLIVNAKNRLEADDVRHIANNVSHYPEFVMLKDTEIAGIRGTSSLSDNRVPELWGKFLSTYKNLYDSAAIGYCVCETQQTVYTRNGDASYSVMVGSLVNNFDNLSQPLIRKTLQAGKYAVFTHQGTFAKLVKTYQYIYGTWLPAAREELDDREDFEVYEHKVLSFDDPNNKVKIFIPIK